MNNYEKMTLASFVASLKGKKYESATGARRAVGKAHDLSKSDKEKAQAEINKFFGEAGPKKAAKKVAPKAKSKAAPKKAAKKVVVAKSKVTHVKPKRRHVDAHTKTAQKITQGTAGMSSNDARVMRQHAASQIFSSLYGKAPLSAALEAQLLETSAQEYLANSGIASTESSETATPALLPKERIKRPHGAPKAPPVQAAAEEPAPASGPEPTNGLSTNPADWTDDQRAQDAEIARRKAKAEADAAASG